MVCFARLFFQAKPASHALELSEVVWEPLGFKEAMTPQL
jgi:hypothetical protein